MKRLFLYCVIGCILAILIPSIVSASDTSEAIYTGIIKVTNTGTANTSVCTTISGINTTSLIAGGFLHSSANDSAVLRSGADVAFMPGYGTNPWILYVASIGADSTFNDIFYTPNVPDGKDYYFPGTGGMTTSDAASLELGDNFTVNMTGFINTSHASSKFIFVKTDAIALFVDNTTDGQINLEIYDDKTVTLDGTGNSTNISNVNGAATHWEACDTYNDGAYVYETGAAYKTDLFTCDDITINTTISYITIYVRAKTTGTGNVKTSLRTHSTNYNGDENALTGGWAYYSTTYTTNPNTSIAWTVSEVNDMEIGVKLESDGVNEARCDHVYAIITPKTNTSLTGVNSGEYNISFSADSSNLTLSIGSSSNTTILGGVSTPDNANDIVTGQNGSLLYLGYQEIKVGGVQVQYVDWDYAATFTDQSGYNNDATPTFRTTSSDPDISANLTDFYPVSEATAPAYAVSDAEDFISGAPNITGNFTTSINASFPGSGIIEDTATSGGTPVQMPFIWLGCLGLLAASFMTSSIATYFRSNSILPKVLVVIIFAAALVGLKVFDFWMLLYLIIPLLAFAIAKTHTTWGGESGYNMAGFLAMSFVGMTIINRIMEGAFLSSTDASILNNVLVFRPVNVFGLFQISVPNMSFLTEGLPHLIRWDYSFFGGNAVIIQYLFYSITAFMAFLLFIIMLGVVFNMLSRSR